MKEIPLLFKLATAAAATAVFLYTTFATVGYVDARHESAMVLLREVRESVKLTEARVYELTKGGVSK